MIPDTFFQNERLLVTGGSGFIGTHFADLLQDREIDFVNLDKNPPHRSGQERYWKQCNLLNREALNCVFEETRPTIIVHLAAKADVDGRSIADYEDNTTGTKNLLEEIKCSTDVKRVVITSTQHVRAPGSDPPKSDTDFVPLGLYGKSKVITEQLTREADLGCTWTIVRPTTIWGPYHPSLPAGLWKTMATGLYFHPKNDPVLRSYGYVKNTVWQYLQILKADESTVDRKMFYLGDPVINQLDWINAFSIALSGRRVREVPKAFIWLLALFGEILSKIDVRFPLYLSRYSNLTTSNPVSTGETVRLFGSPPYTLAAGVGETVEWLKHENLFKGSHHTGE